MRKILFPISLAALVLLVGAACSKNTNSNTNSVTTNAVDDSLTNTDLNLNSNTNDNLNATTNTTTNTDLNSNSTTSNTNSTTNSNLNTNTTATAPSTVNVTASNMTFTPSSVTVAKDGSVVFTNNDSVTHTVQVTGFSTIHTLTAGSSFTLSTSSLTAGTTYSYHCTIHPSMVGTIIVSP